MPNGLSAAASTFAQGLLEVLELVCPAADISVDEIGEGQVIIRPPGGPVGEPGLLGTTTDGIDLRFFYRCDLDPEGGYLRVRGSSIGLCLTPTGRSLIRVEYERGKGGDRPDAHVHVDADGALWGRALTLSGQPLRNLHSLHIPAGGRRFRPTMEDFVEFLLVEGFVTPTVRTWRDVLRPKREEWDELQAKAAARRHAHPVAEALRDLGWTVTPP